MKTASKPSQSAVAGRTAGKLLLSKVGGYIATTVGAGVVATPSAEAAAISIDIGPSGFNIAGINAGLPVGGDVYVSDFPFTGAGYITLANAFGGNLWGFLTYEGKGFGAHTGTRTPTSGRAPEASAGHRPAIGCTTAVGSPTSSR